MRVVAVEPQLVEQRHQHTQRSIENIVVAGLLAIP